MITTRHSHASQKLSLVRVRETALTIALSATRLCEALGLIQRTKALLRKRS